jgi:hypothetical protein
MSYAPALRLTLEDENANKLGAGAAVLQPAVS